MVACQVYLTGFSAKFFTMAKIDDPGTVAPEKEPFRQYSINFGNR